MKLQKLAISLLFFVLFISCNSNNDSKKSETNIPLNSSKKTFMTTVLPVAGIVKSIVGDRIIVHSLVQKDEEPHGFNPLPKHLSNLAKSDYYITTGLSLEDRIKSKLPKSTKILNLECTDKHTKDNNDEHGKHDEHNHHNHNPHLWLNPHEMFIAIPKITTAACSIDSSNCQFFKNNAKQFQSDLQNTLDSIKTLLKDHKGKSVFIYHDAFSIFLNEFDLHQVSIEIDGKAPSPQQIQYLIKRAKKENVKVIFSQNQFEKKSSELIAKSIGGKVISIDLLNENILKMYMDFAQKINWSLGNNE